MYSRVYVEITNVCNMSCSFCHGHSRTPQQMSEDRFSQLLDKLDGQTKYIYYHLMGEPLTHPKLPDFLKMAAERGFKCARAKKLLGRCRLHARRAGD
ncbi:MAG: radical SAM protein, partial [Clostridia bacterium]|nr:radical SAM protein [Clostridia bacterium]